MHCTIMYQKLNLSKHLLKNSIRIDWYQENVTWKSFETRFKIAALSGGPSASALTEYLLPVKCALNKDTNQVIQVNIGNGTSGQTSILDTIEIGVKLSLSTRVFTDADQTKPLELPARDLAVGTPLFVRLELNKAQLPANGTKLFVKDCVGMPEADTSDATQIHYIIKDSCPEEDSADFDTVSTLHRVHFKFETFKFGTNYGKLYMSCSAIVCLPGDMSDACKPRCAYPQHPKGIYSSPIRSKREGDSGDAVFSSGKPPQLMGGRLDMMMLRNPDVTLDWPLNPTEDIKRVGKNGKTYLLSNKGRLLRRCFKCPNSSQT